MGNLGVLGLHFPEAFTTSTAGQGFWDVQAKNTSISQGWEPNALQGFPAISHGPGHFSESLRTCHASSAQDVYVYILCRQVSTDI